MSARGMGIIPCGSGDGQPHFDRPFSSIRLCSSLLLFSCHPFSSLVLAFRPQVQPKTYFGISSKLCSLFFSTTCDLHKHFGVISAAPITETGPRYASVYFELLGYEPRSFHLLAPSNGVPLHPSSVSEKFEEGFPCCHYSDHNDYTSTVKQRTGLPLSILGDELEGINECPPTHDPDQQKSPIIAYIFRREMVKNDIAPCF